MRWAQETPTWVLEQELSRRRNGVRETAAIRLPGLEVDPAASRVVWRGLARDLSGRRMEVLYALAQESVKGKRRVGRDYLAHRVFFGMDLPAAVESLRTYVSYLGKEFPGLLLTASEGRRIGLGYGLNLPAVEEAVA